MFDFTCTACGVHRLVFASQVRDVTNTTCGVEVHFDCWCGAAQVWVTGRRPRRRPSVAA